MVCNNVTCGKRMQVTVAAAPEPLIVERNVSSICSSAEVGQYFGFYNKEGAYKAPLCLKCFRGAPATANFPVYSSSGGDALILQQLAMH